MPRKQSSRPKNIVPIEFIERRIYLIRGKKVILDADLAKLYKVETKNLNKAVTRNRDRFPDDFMFRLTKEEWDALRFQFGTSNGGRGGRRHLPLAFTEQGVAMLSSVLRSKRAIEVNIAIMRAFVRLREILASHKDLARKVDEFDRQVAVILELIEHLLNPPKEPPRQKRQLGFRTP